MRSLVTALAVLLIPLQVMAQEIREEGWPVPDLTGLIPYSMSIKQIDGAEKVVEKFYTPNGGQVARISANGRVFAYAIDSDREPPIDYLLLDPKGDGRFTQKFKPEQFFSIPEWVYD